jgi:transposase InsO family protein
MVGISGNCSEADPVYEPFHVSCFSMQVPRNGNIRKELLNAYVFKTLGEVRVRLEEWRTDYNKHRPHKALNYRTPHELLIHA